MESAIITFITILILSIIMRANREQVFNIEKDELIFKMPKVLQFFSVLAILIAPALFIYEHVTTGYSYFGYFLLIWFIVYVWLFLYVRNSVIIITAKGISYITFNNRRIDLLWEEIEKVKLGFGTVVFIGNNKKVKASMYLIGFNILLEKTAENLPYSLYNKNVSRLLRNK